MTKLGGRKFALSVFAVCIVAVLAFANAPAEAYTSIALIVATFHGANGWVEGRWANPSGAKRGE